MFCFHIRGALKATLLTCAFILPISAQTATDTKISAGTQVSLRDAITATLAKNPQLSSFQFRRQAVEGEIQTAALKPALRVDTTLENIAGSGEYKGTQSAEFTLALSSVIELGNKRDARTDVATERQQELAAQQQIVELDLLAEVTRRFIEAAAAQQHLKLQQSTVTLATETAQSIKKRVDVGNTPDAELARAQANLSRMAIELRQAELEFEASKFKLAALWAATEPGFTSISADFTNIGASASLSDLLNSLANNPDIQRFASEARLRDAEIRQALSKRNADVEWSAGVRRLQASNDSALVVGVSVPLFNGNRAAGEVATARANRLGVDNEREVALLQLRAQVLGLYHEREAALFEITSLRNDVIPQLKKAVSLTRAAFDKGRYGYLELSTAQHELLEAEAALIDATAKAHLLRAEIERLSGTATTTSYSVPTQGVAQ